MRASFRDVSVLMAHFIIEETRRLNSSEESSFSSSTPLFATLFLCILENYRTVKRTWSQSLWYNLGFVSCSSFKNPPNLSTLNSDLQVPCISKTTPNLTPIGPFYLIGHTSHTKPIHISSIDQSWILWHLLLITFLIFRRLLDRYSFLWTVPIIVSCSSIFGSSFYCSKNN
jgi:hypothetical protein